MTGFNDLFKANALAQQLQQIELGIANIDMDGRLSSFVLFPPMPGDAAPSGRPKTVASTR